MLATAPATTPASKVVIAVLGASKRSMDSMTSNEEASGAANAAPRGHGHRHRQQAIAFVHHIKYVSSVHKASPAYEPICTEGPQHCQRDNPAETEEEFHRKT